MAVWEEVTKAGHIGCPHRSVGSVVLEGSWEPALGKAGVTMSGLTGVAPTGGCPLQ